MSSGNATRTGTRWGRSSVMMLAGLAAVGGMGTIIGTSAFGISSTMVVQSTNASFSSTQINAVDAGFGMVPQTRYGAAGPQAKPALRAGFATATINGLCVSKSETIAGLTFTIRLQSGDDNTGTAEIQAKNAAFDITSLRASGTGLVLRGVDQIGLATADITTSETTTPGSYVANPLDAPTGNAAQGWTGIDATAGTLNQVAGKLWSAQIEGDIILPKLSITTSPGTGASCESQAAGGTYPR